MKNVKRLIPAAAALAIAASSAACGNGGSDGAVTTIRMMNRVDSEVSYEEDNAWVKAVEEAANVKLEIEAPAPSSYTDKLQITMASGNLPDIIYIFTNDNNYDKWAKDGLLLELDGETGKYPNIMSNITSDMWNSFRSASTGKIHAVPKPNKISYWGYVANKAWLDALGMDAPETKEEFYELAKAVVSRDPDGNGKADTFILSPSGQTTAGASVWEEFFLLNAFDLLNAEERLDADGEYKRRQEYEGYYPYLEFMHKLYEEKLMDPEFFLNKSGESSNKFLQNRVAVFSGHDGGVKALYGKDSTEKIMSDYEYYPMLKTDSGERNLYVTAPVWGGWAISADSKVKDEALKFIDFGNSEEGWRLMNIGVEGVHYTSYNPETKELIRTEEQSALCRSEFSSYTCFAVTYNDEPAYISLCDTAEKLQKYNNELDNYLAKTEIKSIPSVVATKLIQLKADDPDLFTKMDQMEIQYITGEISLEELKDYVDNTYLPKTREAYAEKAELIKAASGK